MSERRCDHCLRILPPGCKYWCPGCEPAAIQAKREARQLADFDEWAAERAKWPQWVDSIPDTRVLKGTGMGGRLKEICDFLRDFIRRNVRCRGCGYTLLDEDSPWQQIALRNWEDAPMREDVANGFGDSI